MVKLIGKMNMCRPFIKFVFCFIIYALLNESYLKQVNAQESAWSHTLAEIKAAIEQTMIEGQIPSLTIALVEDDQIKWSEGFGYSNIWSRTPAVPSSVYLIASTFKAMSTVALLQQMEKGKFLLDDPVHDHLRFLRIRNEDQENPVSFRHLLTHTSGLPGDFDSFPIWGDTHPPSMESYLSTSLRVDDAPLTKVVYSNMAYTLVGYFVQQFSGNPFKDHIKSEIFEPLEMNSTAFAPTPEMTERLAIPYVVDPSTKRLVPTEWINATVWPAGIVYGTVLDQANWLIVNLNGGVFKGRHILDEATLTQMHTLQYEQFKGRISGLWGGDNAGYGLTWWLDERNGQTYFAHSGSVPGYTAFLQGNKEQKIGVAILTNGNRAHPHLIKLTDKIMGLMESEKVKEDFFPGNE